MARKQKRGRNPETDLQNRIRVGISDIAVTHRINVGTFKVGKRYVSTGVPPGFSDVFGHRKSDGKAFYLEVKTETGVASEKQEKFIAAMQKSGAIAGVCRSVAEARQLLDDGLEEKIDKAMQAAAASKEWRKKDGSGDGKNNS